MGVKKLDVLAAIRSNPRMYLPFGQVSCESVASVVLMSAFASGACRVQVTRSGDWCCIECDIDWIGKHRLEIDRLFTEVIPWPEAGINSFHPEVCVTAFAQDVMVHSSGKQLFSRGSMPPPELLARNDDWQLSICFRM